MTFDGSVSALRCSPPFDRRTVNEPPLNSTVAAPSAATRVPGSMTRV